MMKQNTCFKSDGDSCHLFTNYKFEISIYENKFLKNIMSDHRHMIFTILKTKFEKFEPKKSVYLNFKKHSDQFKLDFFNSISAMSTHAAFENNLASISDEHAPKKTTIL